jgi:integrase
MRLTAATIRSLQLPPGKDDKIFFDSDLPGFGLRLRGSGAKTWLCQYAIAGRTRRVILGKAAVIDPGKAREEAKKILAAVQLGGDPATTKAEAQSRSGETFKACMDLYLNRRRNEQIEGKLRAATIGAIERHLDRNLKALHSTRIDKVDRRAIALELSRLTIDSGPIQANRTRASLVKFLNWCAGEGFIDSNPATFTNKNPEQTRDRLLTDIEIRKIWRALGEGDYADILRLLLLTGQREREISELRFDEIDFDRAIITLSPARTKNRRWHNIPLSGTALEILKKRQPFNGRALVFGTGQGGFSGWNKAKIKLDERAKVTGWRIHDLRRTAATRMNEIGVQPHIVEAVLNHVSGHKGGVAGVYNRAAYEAEKVTALARWAEHLAGIIEGRERNVAPLRRPA